MQGNDDFVHGGKGLAALSLGLNIFLTASKYLLYLFTLHIRLRERSPTPLIHSSVRNQP
jgi:hypothetical protein